MYRGTAQLVERRTQRPGAGSIPLCGKVVVVFLLEFTFSTSLWVFYSLRVQSHAPTFVRTLKSITLAATPLSGLFSCTTFVWIHENTAQRLEWVGLLYYIALPR